MLHFISILLLLSAGSALVAAAPMDIIPGGQGNIIPITASTSNSQNSLSGIKLTNSVEFQNHKPVIKSPWQDRIMQLSPGKEVGKGSQVVRLGPQRGALRTPPKLPKEGKVPTFLKNRIAAKGHK